MVDRSCLFFWLLWLSLIVGGFLVYWVLRNMIEALMPGDGTAQTVGMILFGVAWSIGILMIARGFLRKFYK
jgi:hypothetical protein